MVSKPRTYCSAETWKIIDISNFWSRVTLAEKILRETLEFRQKKYLCSFKMMRTCVRLCTMKMKGLIEKNSSDVCENLKLPLSRRIHSSWCLQMQHTGKWTCLENFTNLYTRVRGCCEIVDLKIELSLLQRHTAKFDVYFSFVVSLFFSTSSRI